MSSTVRLVDALRSAFLNLWKRIMSWLGHSKGGADGDLRYQAESRNSVAAWEEAIEAFSRQWRAEQFGRVVVDVARSRGLSIDARDALESKYHEAPYRPVSAREISSELPVTSFAPALEAWSEGRIDVGSGVASRCLEEFLRAEMQLEAARIVDQFEG